MSPIGRRGIALRYDSRTGGLAQLGERRVRNAEVEGSNPLPSTIGILVFDWHDLAQGTTYVSTHCNDVIIPSFGCVSV